jgi:hypothetical protein
MPRKKTSETKLDKTLDILDKKVEARGKAVLAEHDLTGEIVQLIADARAAGGTMPQIREHVKRMDPKTRTYKPISRQLLDYTLAVHEGRRPARTTRESRKSKASINVEALQSS